MLKLMLKELADPRRKRKAEVVARKKKANKVKKIKK